MFTYKQHITIDDPNYVVLSHLPFRSGQRVEVLFLAEDEERLEAHRSRFQEIDQVQQRGRRMFGAMKDKARVGDAFFEPLPESELAAWEGIPLKLGKF